MKAGFREKVLLFLKGMGMGAADIIPGVSGGTIAFITGIYEEFIHSLKSIDFKALSVLRNEGLAAFWKTINGGFLLVLFSGIIISLLSLVKVIKFLLENHPVLLWAFFFGLILASSLYIAKQIKKWSIVSIVLLILGIIISYFITIATPAQTEPHLWYIFLCGMVAICAMILPGISGSFILLLMGQYPYMLNAIDSRELSTIAVFCAGCAVGLIAFSRVLSWTFKKYYNQTLAFLTGFLIGSLNKVWPWKEVLETFTDRHGEIRALVEQNVLPGTYESINNFSAQILPAIVLMVLGFVIVFVLEKVGEKKGATA